ncbi:MAG TPA: RNA polymerase sigma factor [Bacillaceae bacterium]
MIPDHELLKEIKAGSHTAMEVLVKRYYKPIYAFIYRKTGNKENAYDMTQDVFIKMLKHLPSYQERGSFKSWLYTLAVNHCHDQFRSKAFQASKMTEELGENRVSQGDSIPYIFEKNEKRKEVMGAILSLPSYQSDAIILKYYHDMKIREIAEIMDTNESTVKSRLRQGMEKLKAILQRSEEHVPSKKQSSRK